MVKYKNKNSGKTYDVEVGKSYKDKSGKEVQPITINGQKMTLSVQQTADNSGKLGKDIILKIKADSKFMTSDGGYTGISKSEIYSILSARAKSGKATLLENIAVYQQKYNNCAKAEALAKGLSENDADLMKLTDKQIAGKEPLPDLAKAFPWTQDSAKDEFSVQCRKALKDVETSATNDLFDSMGKRGIKDQFALNDENKELKTTIKVQERVSHTKGLSGVGSERFDVAVDAREAASKAKAKERTKGHTTLGRDNSHDMC